MKRTPQKKAVRAWRTARYQRKLYRGVRSLDRRAGGRMALIAMADVLVHLNTCGVCRTGDELCGEVEATLRAGMRGRRR